MLMRTRKLNRLHGFDYSIDRKYFVTSCVRNMDCYFGEIIHTSTSEPSSSILTQTPRTAQMILNSCGLIAERQWYWLEEQYPYVRSHAFVVMPNHVHGILEINRALLKVSPQHKVRTGRDLSVPYAEPEIPIKIKSLSELIGAYKTTVSKQIHLITAPDGFRPYAEFAWHRSFYDHIIRTDTSYQRIKRYIHQNPSRWPKDKYFKL